MNYREFLDAVRQRGRLKDDREALIAISATLKTLGERLTEEEGQHLAAQLPADIGRFITVVDTDKSFDLETFYMHVSERESLEQPMPREHAQAVLSVVEETVSPGELRDVLAQLPEEYLSLFTLGSDWRKVEGR